MSGLAKYRASVIKCCTKSLSRLSGLRFATSCSVTKNRRDKRGCIQKACARGGIPDERRRGKEPGYWAAHCAQRLGLRGTRASWQRRPDSQIRTGHGPRSSDAQRQAMDDVVSAWDGNIKKGILTNTKWLCLRQP